MQLNLGSGFLVHNNGDTSPLAPASHGSNKSLIESNQQMEGQNESEMEQNMLNKYMQENESLRSDIQFITKTYLYFLAQLKTNNELIIY